MAFAGKCANWRTDHGYSEALYLSDPENNGIEIYWDKPEEVWDIRPNGEIIGVTEELDGDSLAAEADGHWLGISEGSKIGHIHLKVADLDTTETFYKNLGFGLKSNFGQQAKFLQRVSIIIILGQIHGAANSFQRFKKINLA